MDGQAANGKKTSSRHCAHVENFEKFNQAANILPLYYVPSQEKATFHNHATSVSSTAVSCDQTPQGISLWRKPNPRALGWFSILHLPSIVMTAALLSLYVGEHQLQPSDHEIKVKLLLVASKIHELLIVISLSSLLHYRIRHALLRDVRGMPLGLLSSPFQLNDPLMLFRRPFLSSASKMLKAPSEFTTCALVILSVLLTLVAAPSSGILILPRLDWWPLAVSGGDMGVSTKAFYQISRSTFPSVLDINEGPILLDDLESDQFRDRYLSLLAGLDLLVKGSAPKERYHANLSIPQGGSAHPFEVDILGGGSSKDSSGVQVACTAPMSAAADALTTRSQAWSAHSDKVARIHVEPALVSSFQDRREWRQPRVLVQCKPTSRTGNDDVAFPGSLFGGLKLRFGVVAAGLANQSTSRPVTLVAVGTEYLPKETNLSAVAILGKSDSGSDVGRSLACLVDARWVSTSSLWIETKQAAISQGGDLVDVEAGRPASPAIPIMSGWAGNWVSLARGFLNQSTEGSGDAAAAAATAEQSPVEHMVRHCFDSMTQERLSNRCVASGLALLLTDALRRTAVTSGEAVGALETASYDYARMEFEYYHYTFSYRFGGWLVTFAFVVLFTHVAMIAVHLVVLLLGGEWHEGSSAWGEIGEMLVLALVAAPPEVLKTKEKQGEEDHKGGGSKGWDLWQHRVRMKDEGFETGEATMFVHHGSDVEWSSPAFQRRKREWNKFSFRLWTFLNYL